MSAATPPSSASAATPRAELIAALVCGGTLALGWLLARLAPAPLTGIGTGLVWLSLALGLVLGGRAAWAALRSRTFDIDVLMVLGAVMAAALGAPAEGALLLFLFTLSGALEDLAMERTTRSVAALARLMPTSALRLDAGTGAWQAVPPESLVAGDRIRIKPGEIVPADSRVATGASAFDQANLTGESAPRTVRTGDEVYAGTLNAADPVEAVVLRPAAQSSLQRVLDLVVAAQQTREPVQRLIDRLSQPYSIGVLVVSLAVLALWRFGFNATLGEAATTAMTLLIVASPCALVISTPTATLAAISRAAKGGVLFKGGQSIERLARVAAVAFDKTGTLTVGRPRVVQVLPINWPAADSGSGAPDPLAVAAALEEHSTHPIAEAIITAARARGTPIPVATDVRSTAGRGLSGGVLGLPARIGSLTHLRDALDPDTLRRADEALATVQHRGQIGITLAHGQAACVIVLADAVRPGAECLVERLHALGVRPVVMLTGDNHRTAAGVARQLGLDEFHAQLLPEDKVAHVARLKGSSPARRVVAVIGDGVNDAPALASADCGIAIGSIGSDAALESADVVLLSDDLSAVPWALELARRARRAITLNLAFSLAAILIMVAAVLIGARTGSPLPLWMGVLGHEGGTLLVVAHSLWLLTHPPVRLCVCDKHGVREAGVPVTISAGATSHA